ncbi:hypothetical protein [Phenylobacterium sp.]|uniref:sulfotransferase family protein n=1 Tax=Phenylobacterium sp. TaxID=1871053 RepID=UPI002602B6BD|nr:hypothetical protein [Phenylobacterium sp.]
MTHANSQSSQAPSAPDRAAYLVLGMHRSGTSALTQVLALAGATLPENVMPGDEHNARGYFEPWRIAIFNDQRLRAGGGAWDDPFAFPYRPVAPREERRWISRATDLFEEEFAGAAYPLMKDPRVSVLAPLWRTALSELNYPMRAVIPVRHPLEVAGSLAKRNGFPVEKSVLLWTSYMLAAEAHSRDMPRAFVPYEGLLSDWRGQAARVEAAHGAALPRLDDAAGAAIDDFLTGDLRHNAADQDLAAVPLVGALAAQVHDWFAAAARDEQRDPDVLRRAAEAVTELRATMGVFVSPVTSALDLARVEALEARQFAAFEQTRSVALERQLSDFQAIERAVDEILSDALDR